MNNKYFVGSILTSNKYGDFEILEIYKNPRRFKIKFILTGYEKTISYGCALRGEIRDPYYPIYFGVGCLGEVKASEYTKELNIWRFMLARCYDQNHDSYCLYGGKGVKVCKDWLCFSNFARDIKRISGYDEVKFLNGELELDKDMSYNGSKEKEYSFSSCEFLPSRINFDEMLARRKLSTSSRYVGVTKLKDGKWQVTYVHKSKSIYGGRHKTEKEANDAYKKLKKKYEKEGE